jgi:preprotein translocase subunit SecY
MFAAFANIFKIPELKQRILFTLGMIFCCRIIEIVPTPGVNPLELQRIIEGVQTRIGGGFLAFVDLFSGGALAQCAVGALGIMPYISASIILQLMTALVPELERLAREGEPGRQKLNQYTKYLTILICIIQASLLAISLENPRALGISAQIVLDPGWGFRLMTVLTMTTATMVLMWIGDQITEYGIGNGISLIITVNIISRLPRAIAQAGSLFISRGGTKAPFGPFHLIGLILLMVIVVAVCILLTQGQRRIPIHMAKRVIGRKVYGGQSTYMPLRVNYSGVMPLIFASVMIEFPAALLRMSNVQILKQIGNAFGTEAWLYMGTYGLLILFFSYFWVATQFNPIQIADDLKRNGGYVPGIRPGTPTAEYLDATMSRVTLIGAIGLTAIAVIPSIMYRYFGIPWLVASFFGGTSLLIVVGVFLDTMKQVESYLLMRHYDGFLSHGRLQGRR